MLRLRELDLTLPSPWVQGVLVLAFLGFGIVVGSATSSTSSIYTASAQPRLQLMLPAAAPASALHAATESPLDRTPPAASPESVPEASGGAEGSGGSGSGTPAKTGSSSGTGAHAGAGQGTGSSGGEGGGSKGGGSVGEGAARAGLAKIKHVFLIVLANEPYAAVFGPESKARYLAHTLEKRGELLVRYYAVAHDELANGIALVSGQGPTVQSAANCSTFTPIAPANTTAGDGQVSGQGCVYPKSTETLAGQLAAKHLIWRAYVQGMPGACSHPTLGAVDPTSQAGAGGEYATFRNPFVYFESVIGASSSCTANDIGLQKLSADLSNPKHTPALSYIVPSRCDDASTVPCAPGQAAGPASADAFLEKVVPQIMASKAYKQGGLLAITIDQAPATGVEADSSACCGQPRFPNLPAPAPLPGGGQLPPSGGGQVGALLLSPFVKPGSVDQDPYNHFSLLRTIEDLFGLKHLGYAAASGVNSLNAAVFAGSEG